MILFQLFSKAPDAFTLNLILSCFGLNGMYDSKTFSFQKLVEIGTRQKIIDNRSYLAKFYIPCKTPVYLEIETLLLRVYYNSQSFSQVTRIHTLEKT